MRQHITSFALTVFGLMLPSSADTAAQPRIAVIVEQDGSDVVRNFGDLLTTGLTNEERLCAVVERQELDTLATEVAIRQRSENDRSLAVARLAKADGLLIVAQDHANSAQPRLAVRLTSCDTGLVCGSALFGMEKKDLPTAVEHTLNVLRRPIGLLAGGQGTKGAVVSLLGIRPTSVHDGALQTPLNTALAHSLTAYPEVAVVERWKLDDVALERTLQSGEIPSLATGTSLLDGSYQINNGTVEVSLRLRSADGKEGESLTVSGPESDPPAIAAKLARAIVQHLGTGGQARPFDAKAEALHYAELAAWLIDRKLNAEAARAAETAVALGDTRADILIDRMRAYAALAITPYDFISFYSPYNFGEYVRSYSADQFGQALAGGLRLSQYMTQMEAAGWKPLQGSRHGARDWIRWLGNAAELNLVLLMEANRRNAGAKHEAALRDLREITRTTMDRHLLTPGFSIAYDMAGFAYETPADGIAAFRRILATDQGAEQSPANTLRYWIWGNAARRAAGMPLVADWAHPGGDRAREAWIGFSAELRKSGKLAQCSDGLAIAFHMADPAAQRAAVMEEYCRLLESHSDELASPSGVASFNAFGTRWVKDASLRKRFDERFTLIMAKLFESAKWLDYPLIDGMRFMLVFFPTEQNGILVSEATATKLLAAIDTFERNSTNDPRWKTVRKDFPKPADLRNQIYKLYPRIWKATAKQPEAIAGAVPLRAWVPGLGKDGGATGHPELLRDDLLCDGKNLLGILESGTMMVLDTKRMSCRLIALPEYFQYIPYSLASDGSRVWFYSSKATFVCDYQRQQAPWRKLPEPFAGQENVPGWRLTCVNGKCYASSAFANSNPPPPLQVCELTDDKPQWLINSNRRPAVHPLDQHGSYQNVRLIYRGAHGKAVVVAQKHPFIPAILAELETGKPVTELRLGGIQPSGDFPLAWMRKSGDGDLGGPLIHVVGLTPDAEQPVLLFRSSNHRWTGEWATKKPLLDSTKPEYQGLPVGPIMRRGKLWLMKYEATAEMGPSARFLNNLRLVAVDPEADQPVVIPIHADIPPDLATVLAQAKVNLANPQLNTDSLRATPDGLFIMPVVVKMALSPVLFHIRWSDVDAWLEQHNPGFLSGR